MSKELLFLVFLFILATAVISILMFPPRYEPEEGVWFCEELQIQISYEKNANTFLIENGEKINCACGSDRGVKELQVYCQEWDHPTYRLDEMIFCADIKKLTDKTLTVFDPLAKQEYIFIRIDIKK